MTMAEQDELGRELTDVRKRLDRMERQIERLTETRAIHSMDPVGTRKVYTEPPRHWNSPPDADANR